MPEPEVERSPDLDPLGVVLDDTDLMWRAVLDAIDGLTAEEFLWEPVEFCWTLRPDPDYAGTKQDWMPAPPVAPFTTIAWRLAHIGQSLAAHARRLFGQGSFSYDSYRPAGDVAGTRSFLEESFQSWRTGIAAVGDRLTRPLAAEVLSFNHHHLGHAKEVDAIRQLFRAHRPAHDDRLVDACLRGDGAGVRRLAGDDGVRREAIERWPDLVRAAAEMGHWPIVTALLDLGWPADSAAGATALHSAAAFGPIDVIERLLDCGADMGRRDPEWDATPQGWAEHFNNGDNARYLATRQTPPP